MQKANVLSSLAQTVIVSCPTPKFPRIAAADLASGLVLSANLQNRCTFAIIYSISELFRVRNKL